MYKKLSILLIFIVFPWYANATELVSGKFVFTLPGDWEVVTEESGAVRAQKQVKKIARAFIVSIYYPPSVKEGSKLLIYLHNYLETLEKDNKDLVRKSEFVEYKTARGAPFTYIIYSDDTRGGFFIGASLGSNAGVMMITYEGNGTSMEAINELKLILDSMKYNDA